MMKRRTTIVLLASVLISVALLQSAFSAGRNYVDRRRVIRVGILIPDNPSLGGIAAWSPAAPYIFYIMDQRVDLKPAGWSFMNPLAGGKDSFKNFARYWQVPIRQTTLENLAQFDVLYLNATNQVGFEMSDRDKLRRFVDGGGCLWIDNGGGMTLSMNPAFEFFLPGLNFATSGGGVPYATSSLHPLLTNPFWLGPQEIGSLDFVTAMVNPGFKTTMTTSGDLPNPTTLAPVVATGGSGSLSPTIAAIEYGSGRVVATSGFIAAKIEYPITGASPGASIPTNLNMLLASPANLRFAYNVIAWASGSTTFRKNYRHNGFSLENAGAPLVNKWKAPAPGNPSVESSPVVWKNVVYHVSGNTIYALDATPEEDLDMDGNPDDGLPDPPGTNTDIVWMASINGASKVSSPTLANMIDPKGGNLIPRDFVFVTADDTNLVHVFEALPGVGRLSGSNPERTDLWPGSDMTPQYATPAPIAPPIVQNGWIYAAGPDATVYGHCPVYEAASSAKIAGTPGASWRASLSMSTGQTGNPGNNKSGLMLSFLKSRTTGAVMQMLSFMARPDTTVAGLQENDFIYSIPVFISSERLSPKNSGDLTNPAMAGKAISYVLQSGFRSLYVADYPAPRIWAVDSQGRSKNVVLEDYNMNPGEVSVSGDLGPDVRVFLSYALDYSRAIPLDGSVVAYRPVGYELEPRPVTGYALNLQMDSTGTPAIGPNDSYYLGVKWPGGTGTGDSAVYCVRYEGGFSGSLKWPYFFHGGGSFSKPSYNPTEAGGSFPLEALDAKNKWGIFAYPTTNDGSGRPSAISGNPVNVTHLKVSGTPAVTNSKVFVTATGQGGSGIPGGYLMCLKSDPSFVIRANQPFKNPATGDRVSVTIWQPDLLFSTGHQGDVSLLARPIGGDMVDYDNGTITITDFAKVRLRAPMPGNEGMIIDAGLLTPSLPVWVFLDGTPVPIEQMDFSGWNNLLWALPLQHEDGTLCRGVSASPVVLGNYVYFVCDDGCLFAVDADATPKGTNADYRILLKPNLGTADDIKDWNATVPMRRKVDQVSGASGLALSSCAGAGGMVAAPTSEGLYMFYNPLTLVTDNHRVMEIGGDGKISWACDSVYEPKTLENGLTMTPGQSIVGISPQSLNKPVVAQKFGGSDYLVVDSGNDRVIRMDRSGIVMWSLKNFADPRKLLRSGEPKFIKDPADARMWSEMEHEGDKWFYVLHCLVVDTGNFRIVDIVDRFNASEGGQVQGPETYSTGPDAGKPIGHQLRWVSNTTYRDKRFTFNSVQLVRGSEGDGDSAVELGEIWTSVSNFGLGTAASPDQTSAVGGGHLGGAILALKYRKSTGAFQWEYFDGQIKAQLTNVTDGGNKVALSGPRFFSVLNPVAPKLLICDSSAVYVTEGADGQVKWKLDAAQYKNLGREIANAPTATAVDIPFSPYRAQMTANNRMLIVNNYAGKSNDSRMAKFTGEIFDIDYQEGVPATTIHWYAPTMTKITTDGVSEIVQQMENSTNLDQPTCAQSLY